MPDQQSPTGIAINRNTGIALGLVVVLVGGAFAVAMAIARRDNHVDRTLIGVQNQVQRLETKMEAEFTAFGAELRNAAQNRWTAQNHEAWSARLQLYNPEMRVPDPSRGNEPFETMGPPGGE